jgi:hypothetical protein
MRIHIKRIIVTLLLAGLVLTSCSPAVPAAVPTVVATAAPAAPTAPASPMPTAAPAATPTPVLFLPPAARFLPAAADLTVSYEPESSLVSENLAAQASLPVPKENLAAASFRNVGGTRSTDPQDGVYYRLTWWVVLTEGEANARFLYGMSQSKDYARQAFLLVMPAAIHEQMTATVPIQMDKSRCEDIFVSSYVADSYKEFRQGNIPTPDPKLPKMTGNNSAEELAKLPPDLFLYATCRVNNALILFWGHTASNYDGKNNPIPQDVIAGQVQEKLDVVIDKLKAQ